MTAFSGDWRREKKAISKLGEWKTLILYANFSGRFLRKLLDFLIEKYMLSLYYELKSGG